MLMLEGARKELFGLPLARIGTAHLIGFVGLVVILLGVLLDGVRRTYRSGLDDDPITPARATSTPTR